MKQYGISGECNWHRDNIEFPSNRRMNLIITWNGRGTSCLPMEQSDTIKRLTDAFIEENRTDYENITTPYNFPITPISSHHSPLSNHMTILSMAGKQVLHRRNSLLETDIGQYRYVLNIYYD